MRKNKFCLTELALFFFLGYACPLFAQVTISAGAQFQVQDDALFTLRNTNLVNNGSFSAGTGTIIFTGSAASSISGSQPIQFYKLAIDKSAGSTILLQRMIAVTQEISFTNGFLDLNNNNIDLGTTGSLTGEQENSRIIGINGGQVLFSTVLNAPVSADPANLGAIITSSQNLGNVIIRRGHQSQQNMVGQGSSVLRYFDIIPQNNAALDASLRFRYFDGELNSIPEPALVFWKSVDNVNWSNQGYSSKDNTLNYVEKTGITSFSRWTLSSFSSPLPVQFISFNLHCKGNAVELNWKTAQEQNSSHFNIERSVNGINWTIMGRITAAGNSNTERSYQFTDNNPAPNCFYRIAEYDINNRIQYTGIQMSSCDVSDMVKVWPNPFRETVFINISTGNASQAFIKIFDSKGSLVKIQTASLLQGNNQLILQTGNLAKGIYHCMVEWNEGRQKRTVKLVKN